MIGKIGLFAMIENQFTPKKEIIPRIEKLQADMKENGCDGVLIIHHTNLFYFSGTSQNGHLFIPCSGKPLLMIKKSFARAKKESAIENIILLKSLKKLYQTIQEKGYNDLKRVGFELDVIPYNIYSLYKRIFKNSEIIDISDSVKKIRLLKSSYEIDLIKRACLALDEVFCIVPEMIREGMTEIELASLFEAGLRKRGYSGCSKMRAFNQDFFFGNLVSGSNGAVPTYFDGPVGGSGLTPANNPHGAGWKKIRKNEIIYIDYTCVKDGYTSDAARIFTLGDVPDKLQMAHRAALSIKKGLMEFAKPGVMCQDIYNRAIELASKTKFSDNFMGIGENKVKFVGHGVGLELDEFPIFANGIRMKLKPGMTFALEPKFVFEEGAVGIENTYVVEKNGVKALNFMPEEITVI